MLSNISGLFNFAFYLPDIDKGFPFLRIGIDNLSKEFGHLPVSIHDYFDRSLKNKKILQVFLTLSLLKLTLKTIPLLDPGLHIQYCGYTIILHMEQENQWKSGQLLAIGVIL
jgi:hypothetical protein